MTYRTSKYILVQLSRIHLFVVASIMVIDVDSTT